MRVAEAAPYHTLNAKPPKPKSAAAGVGSENFIGCRLCRPVPEFTAAQRPKIHPYYP